MDISELIKRKKEAGLTDRELSELSGIPFSTIYKIFSGATRNPRHSTLSAIEAVLAEVQKSPALYDSLKSGPVSSVGEEAFAYSSGGRVHTLDDYYALPGEQRTELIDGEFYDMAAPSLEHQRVLTKMGYLIEDYISGKKGGCITFVAPVDVQLDGDDKTMVQPDLVIVCDKSKLTGRCIMGAPDFVLEIFSPSTKNKDAFLKLGKYLAAGVREYWMVDIEKSRIVTYFFEKDYIPVIYGFDDVIPVGIYHGELEIDFSVIKQSLTDLGE